LVGPLRQTRGGLLDRRTGDNTRYSVEDIGLSAFPVFFTQSSSFLAHQQTVHTRGVPAVGGAHSLPGTIPGPNGDQKGAEILSQPPDGRTPAPYSPPPPLHPSSPAASALEIAATMRTAAKNLLTLRESIVTVRAMNQRIKVLGLVGVVVSD